VISKIKKEKGFVPEERKPATDHKSSVAERKLSEKTSPDPQNRGLDKVIERFANMVSEISDLQRLYSELEKQYEQERKLRQDADRTLLDLRQQLESMNQQLYQSPYPFNQRPVTQLMSDPSHIQYPTSSPSLHPGPPKFAAPLPNMSTIIYPGESERVASLTQQNISPPADGTFTIRQDRESQEPLDAQPPSNESTLPQPRDHENKLRNITHPDNATDKPIESASPVETERASILQNTDSENPVDAIPSLFNLISNDSPIQSIIPRITNPQNQGVDSINPPQPSINTVADPINTTIDVAASQRTDLGKNGFNFGNESVTDTVSQTVSKSKTYIAEAKARKKAIADARRANLEKARAKQSKPESSSTITSKSDDTISGTKEVPLPFASFNSINRDSDSLGSSDELKEEELKEMIENWQRENAAIIFEDDCSTIFESY
jgi:hypothetical protein